MELQRCSTLFLFPPAVPSMQFGRDTYTVKEPEGALHIPVLRSGDLSYESSVRCYTRSQTAEGTQDFAERRNTEESRITFFRGEKVSGAWPEESKEPLVGGVRISSSPLRCQGSWRHSPNLFHRDA